MSGSVAANRLAAFTPGRRNGTHRYRNRYLGIKADKFGQTADVRVAVGGRAEPVRVHVNGLQARREGAGHVVPQAVPDVQDGTARGHAQGIERKTEDLRVGLGHADHRGVEDDTHWYPGSGGPGPSAGSGT